MSLCLALLLVFIIKFDSILNAMANYLIVDQVPRKADVIIVLGGGNDRVEHGVSLYQMGYANEILFTGGSGANDMARYALSLGVTQDHILIEDQSHTTFENAKFSLKIIPDQGYKSAIVVTSPYHTRRSSIIFTQVFKGIDVTICSVPYDPVMTHNWWNDNYSTRFVISEYFKLIWHYLFEWH